MKKSIKFLGVTLLPLLLNTSLFANNDGADIGDYNDFLKKIDVSVKQPNNPQVHQEPTLSPMQEKVKNLREEMDYERTKTELINISASRQQKNLDYLIDIKRKELSKYKTEEYIYDFTYLRDGDGATAYIQSDILKTKIDEIEKDYVDSIVTANTLIQLQDLKNRNADDLSGQSLKQIVDTITSSISSQVSSDDSSYSQEVLTGIKSTKVRAGQKVSEKVMIEKITRDVVVLGLYSKKKEALKKTLAKMRAKRAKRDIKQLNFNDKKTIPKYAKKPPTVKKRKLTEEEMKIQKRRELGLEDNACLDDYDIDCLPLK